MNHPSMASRVALRHIRARGVVTVPAGSVMFHGTLESFSGSLRPGGDGLVWFADNPAIAQLYIPRSGGEMYVRPRAIALPSQQGDVQELQRLIGIEYDYARVVFNHFGDPQSFPVPKGWQDIPSEGDVDRLMQRAGWEKGGSGSFAVRTQGGRVVRPGDEVLGRLYVVRVERDLVLWGKSVGDSDELDLQYNDIRGFKDAEREGLDGALIDDFAQSEARGNIGHPSVGVFRHALDKIDTVKVIPAPYREWNRDFGTPEYPNPRPPYFHRLGRP